MRVKDLIPLLVLLAGIVLSRWLAPLAPLIPYTISGMLFLTFLRVRPRDLRLQASHGVLLLIQLVLAGVAYFCALPLGTLAAQSALLLFLTPAATAAPTIVMLLGGQAGYTTTYVLLSHTMIMFVAPAVLPLVGDAGADVPFITQASKIFWSITPLIVPAIAFAWGLLWLRRPIAERISRLKGLPFFIWLLSLLLLMAHTAEFMCQHSGWTWQEIALLAGISLIACLAQYFLGHTLASRLGAEQHAIRHALGQKNTTLSLWLASLFLLPLSPVAIACYIIWQNIILTYLLARFRPQT